MLNKLFDWTIIKKTEDISYIIGVTEFDNKIIHTTDIQELEYLHNDFVIVITKNSRYKLYFNNQFIPTCVDTKLVNWKIENNRLIGDKESRIWETTPIVRIVCFTNYQRIYTESGSDYIVYWSDYLNNSLEIKGQSIERSVESENSEDNENNENNENSENNENEEESISNNSAWALPTNNTTWYNSNPQDCWNYNENINWDTNMEQNQDNWVNYCGTHEGWYDTEYNANTTNTTFEYFPESLSESLSEPLSEPLQEPFQEPLPESLPEPLPELPTNYHFEPNNFNCPWN